MSAVRAIEYFSVLGRRRGVLRPKGFRGIWAEEGGAEDAGVSAAELWEDAITDIAVVRPDQGEVIEAPWEPVLLGADQEIANLNDGDATREVIHLAVKRRKTTKKRDHITKIVVWQAGDPPLEGCWTIQNTISGAFSADLNPGGTSMFLGVEYAPITSESLVHGHRLIDDIMIIGTPTSDESSPGYSVVDKNLNKNAKGSKLFLAYHHRGPMGLCDLRYECDTLDRYPLRNHSGLELPVQELPIFTFPHDLRIQQCSRQDFPLPDFFTFVFTDVLGRHMHAACLRFYEVVPKEDILVVFEEVYKEAPESFALADSMEIVCPKVICVLSQKPYYRAMGRLLRQLYTLSLSPIVCPIEEFIVSVVAKVPLPLAGGRPYHVILDDALISPNSKSMAPIVFDMPRDRFFPLMDLDFAGPLRCLSVENLLNVFCLLLREAKVLFTCCSNAMLTEVMETLRVLLFPLTWSSSFITRLPDALSRLLEAPGGFMIGMTVVEVAATETDPMRFVRVGNRHYERKGGWTKHLQTGTYIVDLSDNALLCVESVSRDGPVISKLNSSPSKLLPQGPKKRIESKLQSVASKYSIGPQTTGLEQFDSAFEFQSFDPDGNSLKWDEFPTLEIRDAFIVLMIEILGNPSAYMVPPSENIAHDDYRAFEDEFLKSKYINDADKGVRQMLQSLIETQMFSLLLQQRADSPVHFEIDFYESMSDLLNRTGLSALPSSDKRFQQGGGGQVQRLNIVDLPAPLFVLYAEFVHLQSNPDLRAALQDLISSGAVKGPNGKPASYGNKLLDELLLYLSTRDVDTTKDRISLVSNENLDNDINKLRARSKIELADSENLLVLGDIELGPVAMPGPCNKVYDENGDCILTKYTTGWPALDVKLLEDPITAPNSPIAIMAARKKASIEMKKFCAQTMIRSAEVRQSMLSTSPLLTPMRNFPSNRSPEGRHDSMAAISIVMDVYSTSLTLLSLRIINKCKEKVNENEIVADILQIMGIVAHLEGLNLMQYLSECVMRSVILACGSPRHFSDYRFLHSACCALYHSMCNSARLAPGSLTYGSYAMALSAFKKAQLKCAGPASLEPSINSLDSFMHLQDLGLAWFSDNSSAWFPECEGARLRTATEDIEAPKSDIISGSPSRSVASSSFGSSLGSSPKTDLWARLSSNFSQSSTNSGVRTPTKRTANRVQRYEALSGTPVRLAERLRYCKNQALLGITVPSCYEVNCIDPDCVNCEPIRLAAAGKSKMRTASEVFPVSLTEGCGIDAKFVTSYVSDLRNIKFSEVSDSDLLVDSPATTLAPVRLQHRICVNDIFSLKVAPRSAFPVNVLDNTTDMEAGSIETTYYLNIFASSALGRVFTICLKVDETSTSELMLAPVDFTKIRISVESVDHDTLHFEFRRVVVVTVAASDNLTANQESKVSKSSSLVLGHGSIRVRDFPLNVTTRVSISLCETPSPMSPMVATAELGFTRMTVDPEFANAADKSAITPKVPVRTNPKSPLAAGENTGWKNMMSMSISKLTKNIGNKPDGPSGGNAPQSLVSDASQSQPVAPGSGGVVDSESISKNTSSEAGNSEQQTQAAEASKKKSYSSMFNAFSAKVKTSTAALREHLPDKIFDSFDSNKPSQSASAVNSNPNPEDTELKEFVPNSIKAADDEDLDSPSSSVPPQPEAKRESVDLLDMSPQQAETAHSESVDLFDMDSSAPAVNEASPDLLSMNVEDDPFASNDSLGAVTTQSIDLLCLESDNIVESKEEQKVSASEDVVGPDYATSFDEIPEIPKANNDADVIGIFQLSSDSADCIASDPSPRRNTFDSDAPMDPPMEEEEEPVVEEPLPELISNRSIYQKVSHKSNIEKFASSGRALGIFSEVTCPACGFVFQDEEIFSAWASSSSSLASSGPIESSILGRNRADYFANLHRVKCFSCSGPVDPKLQIREYRVAGSSIEVGFSASVTLISTFCIRFTIEYLINLFGPSVLHQKAWLHFPELFWSLKWYSQRMNCPTGYESKLTHSPPFPDILLPAPQNAFSSVDEQTSELFFSRIIYGWRESNVRHRIQNILLPSPKDINGVSRAREVLQSYFPCANNETLAAFDDISAKYLDGSSEGMRRAIINAFPHCGGPLFTTGSEEPKERNIYIVLMVLSLTTDARSKLGKHSQNMPVDIEKGVLFDVIYSQSLAFSVTPEDLLALGTTQSKLIAGQTSKLSQAMRLAFGVRI